MGQGPSAPHNSQSSETYEKAQTARDFIDISSITPEDVPPPAQRERRDENAPVWTFEDVDPFTYGGPIPANVRPKNIVLFGETGVGKSSIINLMANAEVAAISSSLEACTMESTEYTFTLSRNAPFRIYDTVGLNEPEMDVNALFGAIGKAHKLVKSLRAGGGIDLLICCIRSRLTATVKRNHRLFFEFLCNNRIPLAVVVTHLENEDSMEGWWENNEETLRKCDIHPEFHACITAAPARTTMIDEKRRESRQALHDMLHEAFSLPSAPYVKEEKAWLISLIGFFKLVTRPRLWTRKGALLERLEKDCSFSRSDAEKVAEMLLQ